MNAAGRSRLHRDRQRVEPALRDCSTGRVDTSRWRVTRFRGVDGPRGYLVVELASPAAVPHVVREASARYGLTPAQTRVLAMVARGFSNATIAAELGIAERTVEAHVTAILEKAQVPSRAALIARVVSM